MNNNDDLAAVQEFYNSLITEKKDLKADIEKNKENIEALKKELEIVDSDLKSNVEFSSLNSSADQFSKRRNIFEEIINLSVRNESYQEKYSLIERNISFLEKFGKSKTDDKESISQVIINLNEMDRKRIARELHDTTIQNLVCLIHKVELAMKYLDMDPIRVKLELSSMIKYLREDIDDIRSLIYDLRPMSFDDLGFEVLLKQYLDELNNLYPNEVVYHINADFSDIKEDYLITIYRIIKECCINSIKHSDGGRLDISISEKKGKFEIRVSDNGKGCDLNKKVGDHHYGLKILKDRVALLNGKMKIVSEKGKGYSTEVFFSKAKLK